MAEQQIIEIEAESLEEVREQVKSQIPEGLCLLSEKVISDGKPRTVRAMADTTEGAYAKAKGDIPANASVLEKKEIATPSQKAVTVEAFDEQSAIAQATSQTGNTAIVKAIGLTAAGKGGFLGIGKKPNQYEAEVFQQAVVEITYKTKAKIAAEIGKEKIKQDPNVSRLISIVNSKALTNGIRLKAFDELNSMGSTNPEANEFIEKVANDPTHDMYLLVHVMMTMGRKVQ